MAIRNTMADNHLSSLAKKGRYGDTEIAKTSQGKLWHVNKQEKSLIDMYGESGERIVDRIGSGTINPKTGLEEKFAIMTAIALGSLALGAYSAIKGGSTASDQARYESEEAAAGVAELRKSASLLDTAAVSKRQAATLDYSTGVEQLSAETGIKKEDLEKQTAETIQKTGLSTSGAAEEQQSTMWGRIRDAFGRGTKGLMSKLGEKMGDIEGWFESEKARIASEKAKFERMGSLAKDKEDAWYLGKNIGL